MLPRPAGDDFSEVHPFADGNGRIARILMNAELSANRLQRVVVPLVHRDNYLQS
jgi:Fic family protein